MTMTMTMTTIEQQVRWCSEWAAQLGGAAWISGPDRKLLYLNSRAENLLGASAAELLGQRCDAVVAATAAELQPFCARLCSVLRLARGRAEIPPVDLRVARDGSPPRWIRLIAFAFGGTPQKDPYLVECGLCLESERAVLEFMHRIAARSRSKPAVGGASPFRPACRPVHELAPRERQILDLLTADYSHARIAAELRVRPVTVRNHIQHLLAKLGVHSTLEAVALNLMHESDGRLGAATRTSTKAVPVPAGEPVGSVPQAAGGGSE